MKYLDLTVQSVVLLLGVAAAITSLLMGDFNGIAGPILYMQLFLGPWQYIGSLISVVVRAPLYKQKAIHLVVSSLYLLTLILISKSPVSDSLSGYVVVGGLTVPACALAIYYYTLTWRWARQRSHNGKFLPHINF